MKQTNLELNIEKLILPDLPPRQRARVAAAIEQELTRLWTEQGLPPGVTGDSLALNAASVQVAAGMTPDAMGVQVAQSIYHSLAGHGRPSNEPGKGVI
jgi:hypothetical protein